MESSVSRIERLRAIRDGIMAAAWEPTRYLNSLQLWLSNARKALLVRTARFVNHRLIAARRTVTREKSVA